ncbi:hypothetical protein LCGC14_1967380, partial [marine sediment metagenome]
MPKRKASRHKDDLKFLEKSLQQNGTAKHDGPKRKTWST